MEAPEKIYLATTKGVQNLDTSFVGIAHSDPQDIVEPIEYIRKDAFIEKACDSYCRLCDTKECGDTGECDWVEKFRKRLMR